MKKLVDQNRVKPIITPEIFVPHQEVWLHNLKETVPIKFKVQIAFHNEKTTGLNLPENWRKISPLIVGMKIKLVRMYQGGVYTLSGEVGQVCEEEKPNIIVCHNGKVVRKQRRLFYRVGIKQPFLIAKAILPEGKTTEWVPAVLNDISASGIGFNAAEFMAPGTTFTANNLLDSLIPKMKDREFEIEIIWCKVNKSAGYHFGGEFEIASAKYQDEMARMINRLQMIIMAKHYHVVGWRQ